MELQRDINNFFAKYRPHDTRKEKHRFINMCIRRFNYFISVKHTCEITIIPELMRGIETYFIRKQSNNANYFYIKFYAIVNDFMYNLYESDDDAPFYIQSPDYLEYFEIDCYCKRLITFIDYFLKKEYNYAGESAMYWIANENDLTDVVDLLDNPIPNFKDINRNIIEKKISKKTIRCKRYKSPQHTVNKVNNISILDFSIV
jgi:hypothetical protein